MRSASGPRTSVAAPLGLFGESFRSETILAKVLELFKNPIRLALQRVRKLQEQAAISDDLVASFQPAGYLGRSVQAFSKGHGASAKLVRGRLRIDKRLVLTVAQDSGIRERNGILD